jgi:predicted secreted acid phosphatase
MSPENDPTATPRRRRRTRSAKLPLLVGATIAAAGLVFGGIATAVASGDNAHGGNSTHASNGVPAHGDDIPNVTTVENTIKEYYGSVAGTVTLSTGTVNVTLPDPDGNYAAEMHGITAKAKKYLAGAIRNYHRSTRPALVFDVDDTTLNTYDYEIFSNFAFNPTTNADFVTHDGFPAVFDMPNLVNWAKRQGYTVFFLTGRPTTQRDGTVSNLRHVGYRVPTDVDHLYLKPTATDPLPTYLPCATISACTTTQYKSSTRAHIESLGYHVVADFGDQFSDLNGGFAGHTVKLPNPMYFLP